MEVWYGVMGGCGGVLHTLNPRLSDKDLIFIINDAADSILTADLTFIPLLARVLPHCKCVKTVVVMTDRCVARMLSFHGYVESELAKHLPGCVQACMVQSGMYRGFFNILLWWLTADHDGQGKVGED